MNTMRRVTIADAASVHVAGVGRILRRLAPGFHIRIDGICGTPLTGYCMPR
jgi:hypothetical protein